MWGAVTEVCAQNGFKSAAEVRVGSDMFGLGVGYHVLAPCREEHECNSGFCNENGRVDSMLQGMVNPPPHEWDGTLNNLRIWMKGSYVGHQKECHGGLHSIVLVMWVVVQWGGGHLFLRIHFWWAVWMRVGRAREEESLNSLLECLSSRMVLQERSPRSSDAKVVGAGVTFSCMSASLAP